MITGGENGLVQTHPHEFPVKSQNDSSSRSLLGLGNLETHRLQPLVLIGMQGLRGKECGDLLSTSGRRREGEKKKKATPNTSEQQIHLEVQIYILLLNLWPSLRLPEIQLIVKLIIISRC